MSEHSLDTPRVNAADGLSALLQAAAKEGARAAIAELATSQPSRWVPLKHCELPYREVLRLVAAGELRSYGRGHSKYLDREQLDRWLLSHPITEPRDETDELITRTRSRRARGDR